MALPDEAFAYQLAEVRSEVDVARSATDGRSCEDASASFPGPHRWNDWRNWNNPPQPPPR